MEMRHQDAYGVNSRDCIFLFIPCLLEITFVVFLARFPLPFASSSMGYVTVSGIFLCLLYSRLLQCWEPEILLWYCFPLFSLNSVLLLRFDSHFGNISDIPNFLSGFIRMFIFTPLSVSYTVSLRPISLFFTLSAVCRMMVEKFGQLRRKIVSNKSLTKNTPPGEMWHCQAVNPSFQRPRRT